MKKFILMALVASVVAIYQPAKAQVSLNINIGAQPRYVSDVYYSNYYGRPLVHRSYYAPPTRYVYVDRNDGHKKYYRSAKVYRSNYSQKVKQVNYKHDNKFYKHGKYHGKGRH